MGFCCGVVKKDHEEANTEWQSRPRAHQLKK